jgi:hypothetical protein
MYAPTSPCLAGSSHASSEHAGGGANRSEKSMRCDVSVLLPSALASLTCDKHNGAVSLHRQLVRCACSGTSSWGCAEEWSCQRAGKMRAPPLSHHPWERWRVCVGTPNLLPARCTIYAAAARPLSSPKAVLVQLGADKMRTQLTCTVISLVVPRFPSICICSVYCLAVLTRAPTFHFSNRRPSPKPHIISSLGKAERARAQTSSKHRRIHQEAPAQQKTQRAWCPSVM